MVNVLEFRIFALETKQKKMHIHEHSTAIPLSTDTQDRMDFGYFAQTGLTVRQELAARFAAALIARNDNHHKYASPDELIQSAFSYADRFIKINNDECN